MSKKSKRTYYFHYIPWAIQLFLLKILPRPTILFIWQHKPAAIFCKKNSLWYCKRTASECSESFFLVKPSNTHSPLPSTLLPTGLNEDAQGSNWREKCGGKNYAGAATAGERFAASEAL